MAETLLINGRYRVLRPLGDGAEGAVLLVADEHGRGAERALKLVAGVDAGKRERLAGEFRRLASLAHPQLVRVHDLDVLAHAHAGLGPGTPFFTADYIEGQTPIAALARAEDPLGLVLTLAEDIGGALAHVHAAGLVHCDVKPANIVVRSMNGRPEAVLFDLGLSMARGIAGKARGTLAYMAPEALAGAMDPRSDLHALGATLYHAITGAPPFAHKEPRALVRAICEETIQPVAAPWLAPELGAVIMRLLARDLGARHSSAEVLLDDLVRVREALGRKEPGQPGKKRQPAALLPPRLVGRDEAVAALQAAMSSLTTPAMAAEPVRLVRLVGAPGSGRKAIISAAIQGRQLAIAAERTPPLAFLRGSMTELGHSLGMADDTASAESELELARERAGAGATLAPLRWAEELLERAARLAPLVLVLEDEPAEESADEPAEELADEAEQKIAETPEQTGHERAGKVGQERGTRRRMALLRLADLGHPALDKKILIVASTAPAQDAARTPRAAHDARGQEARGVVDLRLEPLSPALVHELVESMVGRPVEPAWTHDLCRKTGGLPRLVVEAVRAAGARAGLGRIESVALGELMGEAAGTPRAGRRSGLAASLASLVVRRAALLGPELAGVLEALAVHGGQAPAPALARTLERPVTEIHAALAELRGLGFVEPVSSLDERDTGGRLLSAAHTRALHQAIPAARRKALHRAALAACQAEDSPDPIACARHLLETGPHRQASEACMQAARLLLRRGELERALDMSRAAVAHASGSAAEEHLLLARVATAAGRYDLAVSAAEHALRTRMRSQRHEARLVLARALQKRGDLDAAEQVLQALVAGTRGAQEDAGDMEPGDAEAAAGAYARLLIARGRHAEASTVAGTPETEAPLAGPIAGPLGPGRALRLESAGLARLYQGNLDGADAAFLRLEEAARAMADRALTGRALALRGMVEHSRGRAGHAAELYGQASIEAAAAGDVHAAAVYDLNQATAHSERGHFGAALRALDSAIVELGRLGNVAELAAAQYNRGIALLALGELASARRAARVAMTQTRTPQMAIYAHLLDGDVSRREGHRDHALAAYQEACSQARGHGSPREILLSLLNLAEVMAENNDRQAAAVLAEAQGLVHSDDDRDRLVMARARVASLLGARDAELSPDFVAELDALGRRAADAGRVDLAWRSQVLAGRLCRGRGLGDEAKRHCREARAIFEALIADTPEPHRDGLRTDPDACALAALAAELGLRPGPDATLDSSPVAGRHTLADLRRLLTLGRRLNSQLSLEPLLHDVMDTAIEMTAAERGFLLLRQGSELAVVVARNFDQVSLAHEEAALSRSIAERAARTGEVVLTVDAAFDDRFLAAESVVALRLRSVLAVPLRQKGQVTGTIYVDHRFRRSAFADEAIELVQELADIAAVAIENARLVEEIRRRQDEIVAQSRRLEAEVVAKEAELVRVRLLSEGEGRSGLRHVYDAIVGQSPAMLAMLRVLDRATDTHLPVVVFGESGTGKELIARALHHNGPRAAGPFVPVNCGAVPEELLESELFGHVRGAFTGADRDRRGLFEVAHGGTLFLDEVGDTSLAMQVKLLRVLQEGEIRRVGDMHARKVNVRIVAASNRRLEDLVGQGRFREDLYYRLHVLCIEVPPLRERLQDIPELSEHILQRLSQGRTRPALTAAALRRLCSHSWPGNVRELENQLARAMALGGDVIDEDLLLLPRKAERAATPPLAQAPTDLMLKSQVEALERRLVEEALRQTAGNQTAAARLLGLSRYGLQKKLKRYGIAGLEP